MGNALSHFWNNDVKNGNWNPIGRYRNLYKPLLNKTAFPAIDQWLGTDLTGDRAATRAEEQRRYEEGLRREDNAYQRAFADARAAGLNANIAGIQPAGSAAAMGGDPGAGRVDSSQGSLGNLMGSLTSIAGLGIQQAGVQNQAQAIANQKEKIIADIANNTRDSKTRASAQALINETVAHDLAIARGQSPPNSSPGYERYRQPQQQDILGNIIGSAVDWVESDESETAKWLKGTAPYQILRRAGKNLNLKSLRKSKK